MDDKPKTLLPPQSKTEIGKSGTYFFKGYITAEEYSIDLQGKYALQVYDVMRKSDPTIHTLLTVIKQPVLGADWDIDPASQEEIDIEIRDRAHRELFDRKIVFHNVLREILTFLDFGHFVAEEVFENTTDDKGTYIGIAKIASRKQRSILKFELDSGDPGITQILPTGGSVEIPRSKLLYVVNDQEGENYLGVSMLRYVYKPWKIKDGLEIMNAIALENQGMGIPYIKKNINGQTTTEPELEKARVVVRQQRANEEGYWEYPDSLEIGFTDMKGHTTKEIIPTIQYQDNMILLSGLSQFLLLGSNNSAGSRAVSADHSRMFVKAIEAVVRIIADAIQNDVINQWVDLNYSNLKNGYPKLRCNGLSDEDVKEISDAISNLVKSGAMRPSLDVENRVRKVLGMVELSDDDYEESDPVNQLDPRLEIKPPKKEDSRTNNGDPTLEDADGANENKIKAAIIEEAKEAKTKLVNLLLEQ